MSKFWNKLGYLFTEDDGSLPEIELKFNAFADVERAFSIIQNLSEENTERYLFYKDQIVSIEHRGKAKISDADERAGSNHIMFNTPKSPHGKPLPRLGVCVWENGLSFDYSCAEVWDAQSLEGLFEILLKLSKLPMFESMSTPFFCQKDSMIFLTEWEMYRSSS